ncbi:MAG: hypothetical protein BWY64_04027 [bacterium ADurb.Bin363]|nr:MAG: hypothetical protein BWY64_04027 [bacterium ADurb.Bin363]
MEHITVNTIYIIGNFIEIFLLREVSDENIKERKSRRKHTGTFQKLAPNKKPVIKEVVNTRGITSINPG